MPIPPDLLTLFDQQERIEIEFPDTKKEVEPHVIRFIPSGPEMSYVLYSRLDETNADAVIEQQIDYFSRRKLPFEWKVYAHDTPADLKDRLIARGFVLEDTDGVMMLDLQNAPPALLEPPTVDIRRLTKPEQLADVVQVEKAVWDEDLDWIQTRLDAHLAIPGHLSVYVAYVDGQPACAGWTYYTAKSQFGSLWGGSTVSAYRKRGLYTAVLAARVQESLERGVRYLVIDAGPMTRPIVARHGFQFLTSAYACEWRIEEADASPSEAE